LTRERKKKRIEKRKRLCDLSLRGNEMRKERKSRREEMR
jgi:hypothetical protein